MTSIAATTGSIVDPLGSRGLIRRQWGRFMKDWWAAHKGETIATVVGAVVVAIIIGAWHFSVTQNAILSRVNAIAEALPDVGVRVAYERIYGPFTSAVLVTEAATSATTAQVSAGVWDGDMGGVKIYTLTVPVADRLRLLNAIAGSVRMLDPGAVSISEISTMSMRIERPIPTPRTIEAEVSFVSYGKPSDVAGRLEDMGFVQTKVIVAPVVDNWNDAAYTIKTNPHLLKDLLK